MMKLAYSLGCYEALIKLGAISPETLARLAKAHGITEAEVMNRVAQGRAAVAKVPPSTPGVFERPTSPAALRGNLQTQRVMEGLPLIGGQREYYTHGTKPRTWQEAQQQARQLGAARDVELTRRLQAQGKVHRSVPGAEISAATPAAEGTAARGTRAATPASLGTADTALHIVARKPRPGIGLAKTVLRRFAHV